MPSSQVMRKFAKGKLHSGSKTGKKVKNRKQAVAIMLSEKRNEAAHGGTYADKIQPGNNMPKGKKSAKGKKAKKPRPSRSY